MTAAIVQLRPGHAIDQCRLAALAELASNYAAALRALVASEAAVREARALVAEAAEAGFDIGDELAAVPEDDPGLRGRLVLIAEHLADDTRETLG